MKKVEVYTAITGGFEPKRDDITCFHSYDLFKSDRRNAKIYKIMPHLFLDSEISIWLDGNIRFAPGVDIELFAEEFLQNYDMAVFRHTWRDCVYREADVCIVDKLDDPAIIKYQVMCYISDRFPVGYGLAECGVIVRKNNARVNAFNEAWWAQVCRFSSRDQISFPYACWKHPEVKVIKHAGNVRLDKRFIYTPRLSSKP